MIEVLNRIEHIKRDPSLYLGCDDLQGCQYRLLNAAISNLVLMWSKRIDVIFLSELEIELRAYCEIEHPIMNPYTLRCPEEVMNNSLKYYPPLSSKTMMILNALSQSFRIASIYFSHSIDFKFEKGRFKARTMHKTRAEEGVELSFVIDQDIWKDNIFEKKLVHSLIKNCSFFEPQIEFRFNSSTVFPEWNRYK